MVGTVLAGLFRTGGLHHFLPPATRLASAAGTYPIAHLRAHPPAAADQATASGGADTCGCGCGFGCGGGGGNLIRCARTGGGSGVVEPNLPAELEIAKLATRGHLVGTSGPPDLDEETGG
eukprot:scaffold20311_cov135-Isochrysis_galbana.AAC.1